MDRKIHLVKAPCHQGMRKQGYQLAPDHVSLVYDHAIPVKEFDGSVIDLANSDNIEVAKGYNELYKHNRDYRTPDKLNDIVITIGGDNSISAATVAASLDTVDNVFVLWIDSNPDISLIEMGGTSEINNTVVSALLGSTSFKFCDQLKALDKSHIIYLGLKDNLDELQILEESNMNYFTAKKVNSLGVSVMIDIIKDISLNSVIHVVLDLKAIDKTVAPCVIFDNGNSGVQLKLEEVIGILGGIRDKIIGFDVVEFNPLVGNDDDVNVTSLTIKHILKETFGFKDRVINVYDEDSPFIIYRSMGQTDFDTDYGWYLLRGLTSEEKAAYLAMIPDDSIISMDIDRCGYLLAKTTINEQNRKTYYHADSVDDLVLFPQEKVSMMFELVS